MVKYLVKITCVPTEKNEANRGKIKSYLHSRSGWNFIDDRTNYERIAFLNGFTSEEEAKATWAYNHPENNSMWNSTAEVIKVEC